MTKVVFEKSEDGKSIILHVKGHANKAPKGADIVCAGASILTYTVAQIVSGYRDAGFLKKKPTIKLDDGEAVITCKPKKDHYNEAMHTFAVAQVGYMLLAQSYPENVQLTTFTEG